MSKQLTCCVTGATGFIARHLVSKLLREGCNVVATVRDVNDTKKVSILEQLSPHKNRLKIVQADLLQKRSFDKAIEQSDVVFHTASPFFFVPVNEKERAQKELVDVAVKGTENVLESIAKYQRSIQRVVVTSSTAAIVNPVQPPKEQTITEEMWNETSTLDEPGGAYRISKTLAEKLCWQFAREYNQQMVAINPVLVLGQVVPDQVANISQQIDLGTSNLQIKQLLTGEVRTIQKKLQGFVNVKDVADAHFEAMVRPQANGNRYLCCAETLSWAKICEMLRRMYPEYKIPEPGLTDEVDHDYVFSNEEIRKDLGVNFMNTEQTLRETIESFKKLKIL